jgi:hypothetical protein
VFLSLELWSNVVGVGRDFQVDLKIVFTEDLPIVWLGLYTLKDV